MDFSEEQILRYSRHIILPSVGGKGQQKLRDAKILVVGAGGLGSPVAMYLAAAGVGKLGLVDFDVVDLSNLQRQLLHGTKDVGKPKVTSAVETIADLNPDVEVIPYDEKLRSENVNEIIRDYDLIVDGSDNFPVRYLVNDAAYFAGKPLIYGSIFQFDGQVSVFPGDGPCYRCLYPTPPPPGAVPSCSEAGVFGVLPGVVGSIQATEAIKLVLGNGRSLAGRLLLFNALDMEFWEVELRRNGSCPLCGENPTVTELIDYEVFCGLAPAPASELEVIAGGSDDIEGVPEETSDDEEDGSSGDRSPNA